MGQFILNRSFEYFYPFFDSLLYTQYYGLSRKLFRLSFELVSDINTFIRLITHLDTTPIKQLASLN